ncbi:MAG TPA: hypothetical protein VEK08_15840 [Planctomycetota bacterium]|nr:hypothetical protein [Planctomycetota bacterium]
MTRCAILVWAVLSAARLFSADTPAAGPAKDLYFIIDFLPPAIYDRDSVTACLRIENTSAAEIKADFVCSSFNDAGESIKENSQNVTLKARGFTSLEASLDSRNAARMNFAVKRGADAIGSVTVRILRDHEPWPATRWSGSRLLIKESGEVLIPATSKRSKVPERAFVPVKWMLGNEPEKKPPSIVIVPAAWQMNAGAARADLLQYGPIALTGGPPLLAAADQIIALTASLAVDAARPVAPRLVICLPAEDLEVATDSRLYRMLLDTFLARVTKLNVKKVVLVPPFKYGAKAKFMQVLWKEVSAAAATFGAGALDAGDFLDEAWWRLSPDVPGVYGPQPNTTGLKNIEQGLFNSTGL